MNVIGEEIQTARRAQGLTQGQLASRLGVSQTHISNIERGRTADASTAKGACRELGLDFRRLVGLRFGVFTPVEAAIRDDPYMVTTDRTLLLTIYRELRQRGPFAISIDESSSGAVGATDVQ